MPQRPHQTRIMHGAVLPAIPESNSYTGSQGMRSPAILTVLETAIVAAISIPQFAAGLQRDLENNLLGDTHNYTIFSQTNL